MKSKTKVIVEYGRIVRSTKKLKRALNSTAAAMKMFFK